MKTNTENYTSRLTAMIERMADTQDTVLDRVARRCVETVERRGLIHLFGSGHSVIPVLDAFPRYGSFVGLHPLTDPRLMWHNVLAPGGVRELLWLEREENYIKHFLAHEPINAGDVLVVYSHSGRNAVGIEAAMYAVQRQVFTVAVTSAANSKHPSPHSTGNNLADVCDEVIDTGVPVEDAIMTFDGAERPYGGTSTILAAVVTHELITRIAMMVVARGGTLPTFVSPTVPGASLSSNDEVFAAHRALLHEAELKAFG
jgi:uncharacterized phosphosugar-binding protein